MDIACGECRHGIIDQIYTGEGECRSCGARVTECASECCPDEGRHWYRTCRECGACPECECGCGAGFGDEEENS